MDLKKITSVPFDGNKSQYPRWRQAFLAFLRENKLAAITDQLNEEDDTKVYNNLVLSLTGNAAVHLSEIDDSGNHKGFLLWDRLKKVYASDSAENRHLLQMELLGCTLAKSKTVPQLVQDISAILEQMTLAGSNKDEATKVAKAHLTKELPSSFGAIKLKAMDPAHSWLAIKDDIRNWCEAFPDQVETAAPAAATASTSSSAPAAYFAGQRRGGGRRGSRGGRSSSVQCHHCLEYGHVWRNCPQAKADLERIRQQRGGGGDAGGRGGGRGGGSGGRYQGGGHSYFVDGSGPDDIQRFAFMMRRALTAPPRASGGRARFAIDSGATDHMCGDISLFSQVFPANMPIGMANGDVTAVSLTGAVSLLVTAADDSRCILDLQHVMHLPDGACLLSVSRLQLAGHKVDISTDNPHLELASGQIVPLSPEGGLFWLYADSETAPVAQANAITRLDLYNLHCRLGHLSIANLTKLGFLKPGAVLPPFFCQACASGHAKRQPVPKQAAIRDHAPGDLVFSDINGPMEEATLTGQRYIINFVDAATGYVFLRLMKTKDEALDCFKAFVEWMGANARAPVQLLISVTGRSPVQTLQSDNDTVYRSKAFTSWCAAKGIQQRFSAPYTQAQNGRAERNWNTIMDLANTLRLDADLPKPYWGLAVLHAANIRNMAPASAVEDGIPFELLLGKKADYSRLRRFGCPAYVHVPAGQRGKLDPKARRGIYVGFMTHSKTSLVYFPDSKTLVESFHVTFDETEDAGSPDEGVSSVEQPSVEPDAPLQVAALPPRTPARPTQSDEATPLSARRFGQYRPTPMPTPSQDDETDEDPLLGDFAAMDDADPFANYAKHLALMTYAMPTDPANYAEAIAGPQAAEWLQAVHEESRAIVANHTFDLVPRHTVPRKPLNSEFILRTKADNRRKARLVVKGCGQRKGVDYDEIFAPVAHHKAIRALLAVAAAEDLIVEQMDVNTAFLIPALEEEIYMELPKGWPTGLIPGDDDPEGMVCRLRKSLYGLKQAPRVWHMEFSKWMIGYGFLRSEAEPCLFIHREQRLLLILYVDDLLVASRLQGRVDSFKAAISAAFSMKDLGRASICLGMRITFGDGYITLDQQRYSEQLLDRFGLTDCNPTVTPLPAGTELRADKTAAPLDEDKARLYREMVGSLLYLTTCTRPDLAMAVNQLTRHMANPTQTHLGAAKQVLRYIKGTADRGLTYRRSSEAKNVLVSYADASFQSVTETSKSVSGFACLLNGAAISWRCKVQSTVAMSTTEAEYVAMSECALEVVYLRALLQDMGFSQDQPSIIYGDNQPAIFSTQNAVTSNAMKHAVRRLKYLRERIAEKEVTVVYCRSEDMIADVLTKILARPQHSRLSILMMGDHG